MAYNPNNPNGQAVMASSAPVVVASNQSAIPVTPPTITKGTQGSTGVTTQPLRDAGRVIVSACTAIAGVTGVTTEALLSLDLSRDGAASSSVTTISVTSTKRFRITAMSVGLTSSAASFVSAQVSLRMNPSGAAAASSTILHTVNLSTPTTGSGAGSQQTISFPDGIELSGSHQVGISQVATSASSKIWASLIGFEY